MVRGGGEIRERETEGGESREREGGETGKGGGGEGGSGETEREGDIGETEREGETVRGIEIERKRKKGNERH